MHWWYINHTLGNAMDDAMQEVVIGHTFVMITGLWCCSYESLSCKYSEDVLLTPISLPHNCS
jgi:hypothetical protein